jgi:hypothetical protein
MHKNKKHQLGVNQFFFKIIHHIVLFAMLHSTFIAPAQAVLYHYYNSEETSVNFKGPRQNLNKLIKKPVFTEQNFTSTLNKFPQHRSKPPVSSTSSIDADLREGIIGVSKDNPLDNPSDNLFILNIDELPKAGDKIYLTYDLYGVNDHTAVARSINQRLSVGGYLVKQLNGWSAQKEEIDYSWLTLGENTVLFTVPNNARHQYKIKNLELKIVKGTQEMLPVLVLPNKEVRLTKNNNVYIKGFIRGTHNNAKVEVAGTFLNVFNNEFEGYIQLTEQSKQNKIFFVKAFDEKGLLGQEIISIDNSIEADFAYTMEDKQNVEVQKNITPCSETQIEVGDSRLLITDNSLQEMALVSLSHLRMVDIAPLGSGIVNVTKGGRGYRLQNSAGKFSQAAAISLKYEESLLPTGYSYNDIKTFFFDLHIKKWVEVKRDSLDLGNKAIISKAVYQGDYINGIIQAPESPETSAFIPTMMNDIKAADPSSELTIVSPPSASQKGNANVSYPIKIPAGRKGLQPQLALQYSNDGGTGWVGQGWNLSIPAITIDTRWGTPVFDETASAGFPAGKETESYLLAGEQLMYPEGYMPNRHQQEGQYGTITTEKQPRNATGNKLFYPRKQGSFAKIERMGNSPSTYYWKVTGTDGTVSWYGGSNPGEVQSNIAVIRGLNNKIIHWALSKVEDIYSNNIIYSYEQGTVPSNLATGANSNLSGGRFFYPHEIWYTGFEGGQGNYRVEFERQHTVRQDATINSRLGIKQVDHDLLRRINIRYNPDGAIIRNYQIEYGMSRFGKMRPISIGEQGSDSKIEPYVHTFDYYDDVKQGENSIYFNTGIEVTVCNDEYEPCQDSDGDGVCDDSDLCPVVFGSASNNGCPDNGGNNNYNCYEVSFPIPLENITWKYDFNIKYTLLESECRFLPVRVKEIQFATSASPSTTVTPPTDLYLTHFQNGALTNLCSALNGPMNNGIILGSWYTTGIRNSAFNSAALSWLLQSVITDPGISNISALNFSNIIYGNGAWASGLLVTQNSFNVGFTSQDPDIEMEATLEYMDMDSGTVHIAEETDQRILSSGLGKSILSGDGINLNVNINGTNLGSAQQYNFGEGLEAFMLAFKEQYGFQAEISVAGNHVRIVVPNSGTVLNSIQIGTDEYFFSRCSKDAPTGKSSAAKNPFASRFGMPDFTFSLNSLFQTGDPGCPAFVNSDFLFSGFLPSFNSAGAILGSSKGSSKNAGLYGGVGYGGNSMTKMTTFGVQYNVGSSKNEAMTALVDINGDGLDDVINRFGNSLYYKAHKVTRTYNAQGEVEIAHTFLPMKPIAGIDNFYRSYDRFKSLNGQITAGWGNFGGFIGKDKSEGDSETDIFFTDGNGDGLMDIVKDGLVYFNKLDANSNPNFVADSKDTENMIITAAPREVELPETQFTINHPRYDVVKAWEAPAAGNIKITNNIELTDTTKEATVTVEMKKAVDHCYQVTFPKPMANQTLYHYMVLSHEGLPYSVDPQVNKCIPDYYSKLVSLEVDGDLYAAENNLFLHMGILMGITINVLQQMKFYFQIATP